MSNSNNLRQAKQEQNDEFYTLEKYIDNEISQYDLKGKVVFCPCDTVNSEFSQYFLKNYDKLKLCGFICSGFGDGFLKFNKLEVPVAPTDCFSDQAAIALDIADIIITNPPFSKFRDFVTMLISKKKKFIILGSQNALSYNDIFDLIQDNKLWLGYYSGSMEFKVPKPVKNSYSKDGELFVKLGNICWYTNVPNNAHTEFLSLNIQYPEFPIYDNYPAQEISRVDQIPYNLKGQAGVPITFLSKYCPSQFDIIGKSDQLAEPIIIEEKLKAKPGRFYLNGKRLYERIVISKVNPLQKLSITKEDINNAISLAQKNHFIDNLRDRDMLLKTDCSVRGYLGEIAIRKYLLNNGYQVNQPKYINGANIDLIVDGMTVEIKTSLLPKDKNINEVTDRLDVKIFVNSKNDTPLTIANDASYRDIYFQIYYDISKEQRENSDLTKYDVYLDKIWLIGIVYKKDWINWLQKRQEAGLPLQWSYQKRDFWYCPLYLSRKILSKN